MRAPGVADPDDVNARDRSSSRRLSRNRHDDDISCAYGTQGCLHLASVEFQRQVVETVGSVGSTVVPQFRLRELVRRGHILNRPEHWGYGARRTAQLDGCWIDGADAGADADADAGADAGTDAGGDPLPDTAAPARYTDPMRWGLIVVVLILAACEDDAAVKQAEEQLRTVDLARVEAIVQQDLENHQAGVVKAAEKLTPGFAVPDPAVRESQMRAALRILQQPKKGIDEFVASPMSFLASLDADGVVIARDREPDRMKGQDYKSRFGVVQQALDGSAATGLGEFFAEDPNAPSSWSILFAAPALKKGKVVGVVIAGIPLWRLAQRLSRQLRVEQEEGDPVWVYLYKGDQLFHWDTPPQIDELVPTVEQRAKILAASPSGYTDKVRLQGELEVYGVFPIRLLGSDLGTVIFRSP